ncbi:MAG: hypothetical protein IM600_01020 [Bacteroidetes bacterium]|nr:hypothetical protein [Bacteroidota bacterium]MCA6441983.1 hypothetical protein [Bacteroidota bacterium]
MSFSLDLGFSVFKNPFYDKNAYNYLPNYNKAIYTGFEINYNKLDLALKYSKTYWFILTPSNKVSPLSSLMSYDFITLKKYLKINNKRKIYFTTGYGYNREYCYGKVDFTSSRINSRNTISKRLTFKSDVITSTSESIVFSTGVNVTKSVNVELLFNYYTVVYSNYFKKGISDHTIQLNFLYKIRGSKNKK